METVAKLECQMRKKGRLDPSEEKILLFIEIAITMHFSILFFRVNYIHDLFIFFSVAHHRDLNSSVKDIDSRSYGTKRVHPARGCGAIHVEPCSW